ncbi:ECF transporter S component [Latilactobacillus graminis]|uniref:Membrane protein n=2 Tax=Latilactobacillus graminis TaxID=60519 RepID=A0AA89I3L4_9LACO|nr:ECF transporter S component [Latilactobacillus graminis]KRM20976.1 membrane protein [Latilactobacillus graminis DSM 20719]QFP79117.1 ECF transporter S component [Latilactobacillus graminis]
MTHKNSSAYTISIMAILTAFLIIQSFIPMVGYINIIPGLPAVTTIHLTVIIGAVILGTRQGTILGLIWGIIALFRAYTSPGDPLSLLIFQNPIIAILPRVMAGMIAGYTFEHLYQTKIRKTGAMVFAGVFGALANTVLVILLTRVLYGHQAAGMYHTDPTHLIMVMLGFVALNAVMEAVLAAIVTPLVATPLLRFKRSR